VFLCSAQHQTQPENNSPPNLKQKKFAVELTGKVTRYHTHTHNRFMALLDPVQDHPGEPTPERQNQEVKTNRDLLEQEIVGGSGISWAICNSAP